MTRLSRRENFAALLLIAVVIALLVWLALAQIPFAQQIPGEI